MINPKDMHTKPIRSIDRRTYRPTHQSRVDRPLGRRVLAKQSERPADRNQQIDRPTYDLPRVNRMPVPRFFAYPERPTDHIYGALDVSTYLLIRRHPAIAPERFSQSIPVTYE